MAQVRIGLPESLLCHFSNEADEHPDDKNKRFIADHMPALVYIVQYILYSVFYTMYIVQHIFFIVYCIAFIIQHILYSVYCTVKVVDNNNINKIL